MAIVFRRCLVFVSLVLKKYSDTFWPQGSVELLKHYTPSLWLLWIVFENTEHVNCLSDISWWVCVFKISYILAIIFWAIAVAVCYQLPHSFFLFVVVIGVYNLIVITKSVIWFAKLCSGWGHKTMVCAVCLLCSYRHRYETSLSNWIFNEVVYNSTTYNNVNS